MAADAGESLKAMVPQVSASDLNHYRFQGGSLTLEVAMSWATRMTLQAARGLSLETLLLLSRLPRRLERAYGHLPLGEADQLVVDQSSQPFQNLVMHGLEDVYWQPTDWSGCVAEVQAPVYLMAGWYDFFLGWQLKDYQALRRASKTTAAILGEYRCRVCAIPVMEMLAVLNTVVLALMNLHQVSTVARQFRRFAFHPEEALPWVLSDF